MIEGIKERLAIKIAWLMPKRLVMWCAYRVAAHATQGQWSNEVAGEVKMMDALGRWPANV